MKRSTLRNAWRLGGVGAVVVPIVLITCALGPIAAARQESGRARPQDPARPFPYVEEEVVLEGNDQGSRLVGTLTLPRSAGPFAAVYLIPGASPFDRDETLLGHHTFLVLSDFLTRRGFAVLRMDDRGVGGSTGAKMQSGFDDLVADVAIGVAYLARRPEIDAARVGVIGHSLGALLAPLVASRSEHVSFLVLMAGSGERWLPYLARSSAREGTGTLATNLEMALLADELLRSEGGEELGLSELQEEWDFYASLLPEDRRADAIAFKDSLTGLGSFLSVPLLREMLLHDPTPVLERLRVPVLALAGDRDPMAILLPGLRAALQKADNAGSTVRELSDLNHLFQTMEGAPGEGGGPEDWEQIEETISPVALEIIASWMRERVGGESQEREK